jgi:8-oxo-dGTP pyrophosphatase MutT (NUDIX family)
MDKENETVVFNGLIGEVLHTKLPDGRIFERYRRPPGVRIIIISPDNKILITKEYRHENQGFDLRLPGGKVRDSLESYHALLSSDVTVVDAAIEVAKKEALEETGLIVYDPKLVTVALAGATVEWDLYYYIVRDYLLNPNGQQLEHGEDIEILWLGIDEISKAIRSGQISEWRSVGVLLGIVAPSINE